MDPGLKEAARTGNISYFYSLIEEKASLWKDINAEYFAETPLHAVGAAGHIAFAIETPLHVAAAAGQIAFAAEMMNLKPAFARTLNQAGFSPMHVALRNGKIQLVYQLLKMDKDLVRVKGREGKTPFHYVVEQAGENEQLLNKFLEDCPECIQDVTVYGDTALHIALKGDKFDTFEYLVKWIRNCHHKDADEWEERVLNWKDEQGNTLLHIAAIKNNLEAVKLLSVDCCDTVDVNSRNLENLTALQYISKCDGNDESNENVSEMRTRSEIIRTLQVQGGDPTLPTTNRFFQACKQKRPHLRAYIHIVRSRKNISDDMRNALLVVMTLIITATYQSALSPPGGVRSAENSTSRSSIAGEIHLQGPAVMQKNTSSSSVAGELHLPGTAVMQKNTFYVLWSYNTLSLLITIGLTVYIIPRGNVGFLLIAPLALLCSSYMLAMSILSPSPQWTKANRILSSVIFLLLMVPPFVYSKIRIPLELLRARKDISLNIRPPKLRDAIALGIMIVVIVLSVIAFRATNLI